MGLEPFKTSDPVPFFPIKNSLVWARKAVARLTGLSAARYDLVWFRFPDRSPLTMKRVAVHDPTSAE